MFFWNSRALLMIFSTVPCYRGRSLLAICSTHGSVDMLIPKFLINGETASDETASVRLSAEYAAANAATACS